MDHRLAKIKASMNKIERLLDNDAETFTDSGGVSASLKRNDAQIIRITVSSGEPGDNGVPFLMGRRTTFGPIYREYGFHINAPTSAFFIRKGSLTIDEGLTAKQAGVNDGDALVAVGYRQSQNTNSNMMTINIHQCSDMPVPMMTLKLPAEASILRVYRAWAEHMDYDIDRFYLIHDDYAVPKYGSLRDNGLKNGCDLFCMRYGRNLPALGGGARSPSF